MTHESNDVNAPDPNELIDEHERELERVLAEV